MPASRKEYSGKAASRETYFQIIKTIYCLYALEDGVYLKDNKPLEVGKCYQLYHGDTFEIGRTTFTYLEKDL